MKRQIKMKRQTPYRTCPYCKDNLDTYEHCNCREREAAKTSHEAGQALQVKMEDWGQYRYAAQ